MMPKKGTISMTVEELRRIKVISEVIEGRMKQRKAGNLLNLSVRQIKRIIKIFRKKGPEGVIHKLRGRASNRKHAERFKKKVLRMYRKQYMGFGPTLAHEKMWERDQIKINRETLRQWLIGEALWKGQRKVSKHLQWRQPKASFGEMAQGDGSHHDWLEGRGPQLVLMAFIDDATGKPSGRFYDYEGTLPAMDCFYRYVKKNGLPHSVYMDRHTTYQGKSQLTIEEELQGQETSKSQFKRALETLGVELIAAHSPQAKGRIERLFRTFQDRLIKEMRLEGIKTQDEANVFLENYLPKYSQRFGRKPRSKTNLHRHVPKGINLKQVFSIQTRRTVRNDNTVRHNTRVYQILNHWKGTRPKKVIAEDWIDGTVHVSHHGQGLRIQEIKLQKKVDSHQRKTYKIRVKSPYRPSINHPWRYRIHQKIAEKVA
jgi:transposase